jgi:hypothetical protein
LAPTRCAIWGCMASRAESVVPSSIVVRILVIGLVTAAIDVRMVAAQKPERPPEVRAPGIVMSPNAEWQPLVYDGCHVVVPGSWHGDAGSSSVSAPDGSNLSIRMFRTTGWSNHKAQIKAAFVHLNRVHEDSDRRLWFEFGTGQHIQHYISSTDGSRICSGLLEIPTRTPTAEATANRIADSIGPERSPDVR